MTDRYWYCNKGAQSAKDVTEAATTQVSTCELRITFTSFTNKIDALDCLEAIRERIIQDPWAPA